MMLFGVDETMKDYPPLETVRRFLRYEPDTGRFFIQPRRPEDFNPTGKRTAVSLCRSFNTRFAGKEALTANNSGYKYGTVCLRNVLAHVVAWAMHYGHWPDGYIDHIDGDRTNNRISNLRVVTRSENSKNTRLSRRNKSGVMGVYWAKDRNQWRVEIGDGNRRIKIGSYATLDEAVAARKAAEAKLNYHANHGRSA